MRDRLEDRFKLPQAVPLMRKAEEIRVLVRHILDAAPGMELTDEVVPDEDEEKDDVFGGKDDAYYERQALKHQMDDLYGASILIPAKIAGAEGGDLYDIRMENATLIRKAARELIVGLRGLEMFGYDEQPYFDLLRGEVEEFRKLFVDWVQAFNMDRFIADDWGLFNPPGVNPGDDIIGDLGYDDEDGPPFGEDDIFGPEDIDPEDK